MSDKQEDQISDRGVDPVPKPNDQQNVIEAASIINDASSASNESSASSVDNPIPESSASNPDSNDTDNIYIAEINLETPTIVKIIKKNDEKVKNINTTDWIVLEGLQNSPDNTITNKVNKSLTDAAKNNVSQGLTTATETAKKFASKSANAFSSLKDNIFKRKNGGKTMKKRKNVLKKPIKRKKTRRALL